MSLIVEDGTGRFDAESFASVATADAYFAGRNVTAWASLDVAVKEAMLRLGTEYLQQHYADTWKGCRTVYTQALDWPRSGVCVDGVELAYNAVPVLLQRAACELALKASKGKPLTADEGAEVKSKTVGPIEVVYADGARQQTRYAGVDEMIRPLLKSSSGSIRIVRA